MVYVESNFVFEISLARDDYLSCKEILDLARNKNIELAIPAFSIGEPYEAWVRRAKNRQELQELLIGEVTELARSKAYRKAPKRSQEIASLLIGSVEEEKKRLDATLQDILDCATVLPLNGDALSEAIKAQKLLDLPPQDSIVYASVILHASSISGPKVFLNRNSRDFMDPQVQSELSQYDCKVISSFANGLGYIQSNFVGSA